MIRHHSIEFFCYSLLINLFTLDKIYGDLDEIVNFSSSDIHCIMAIDCLTCNLNLFLPWKYLTSVLDYMKIRRDDLE